MTTYEKLDPAFKKLWLKALRSGKYERGTNKLRNEQNQFCCLGVACDISKIGDWLPNYNYVAPHPHLLTMEERSGYPGALVNMIVGISADSERMLAMMNDRGETFEDIANWIEENL